MNSIHLQNFRCYSDLSIPFKSGVNLLIGDNASGKTSVLKACKYVLSSFFSGFSDENTLWESPGAEDFQQIIFDSVIMPDKEIVIGFDADDLLVDSTQMDSLPMQERSHLFLTKKSRKNNRALTRGIKQLKNYANNLQRTFINENSGE